MSNKVKLNTVAYSTLNVWNSDGDPVTGLVIGDLTVKLTNPSGVEVSATVTVYLLELGFGEYRIYFTPNVLGPWELKLIHPTYFKGGRSNDYLCFNHNIDDIGTQQDSIEGKIDIVDTNVDSILEDTGTTIPDQITSVHSVTDSLLTTIDTVVDSILEDTDALEADLKTYLDTVEDNIRGLSDKDLTVISTELESAKVLLKGEIDDNEAKIDIIDTVVDLIAGYTDTMEADLKTYIDGEHTTTDALISSEHSTTRTAISTTESNIRGTDSDDLKTISDQLDVVANSINVNLSVPPIMSIPAIGTKQYRMFISIYDSQGNPETPDSLPMIKITAIDGTVIVADSTMTISTPGVYYSNYTTTAEDSEYQAIVTATVVENDVTTYYNEHTNISIATDLESLVNNVRNLNTDNVSYKDIEFENGRMKNVTLEYWSSSAFSTLIKTKVVAGTYDIYGHILTKTEKTTYE